MTSDDARVTAAVNRIGSRRYEATNARGGRIEIGDGSGDAFTPVELLLAAIAGCSAIDVDFLTTKKSEPLRLAVAVGADKLPDHRIDDIELSFDVAFGDDEAGRAAQARVPESIAISHDRLCTVSRTVERGTAVRSRQQS